VYNQRGGATPAHRTPSDFDGGRRIGPLNPSHASKERPWSNRIEEANLDRLVGTGGALTNGSIALLALAIFLSQSTI
jgi:hypothetical protein